MDFIVQGCLVAAGLIIMFCRVNWKWRMRMLSNPLVMDVFVFAALTLIHWGTFSGVMIASIGALIVSMCISVGRKAFGYVDGSRYVPGLMNVEAKL